MKTYTEGELLQNEHGEPLKLFGLEKTEMVFVEAGSFIMGKGNDTAEINFIEGYFIGKYPVTQELYENVMGHNPSHFKGKHRPVEQVSWLDIHEEQDHQQSFLSTFNEKIQKNAPSLKGKGSFKLPSEAQWEYAARGGKKWNNPQLDFAGSQNIKDVAWYGDNSNLQTMPVGLKQPNALGLYDMSGNVWEWCDDLRFEIRRDPNDASIVIEIEERFSVGSCFHYILEASYLTVHKNYSFPFGRSFDIGFRMIFMP